MIDGFDVEELSDLLDETKGITLDEKVANLLGKGGAGSTISKDEFDALPDAEKLYRGTNDPGAVESLYSGDLVYGSGGTGPGIYTTNTKSEAGSYGSNVAEITLTPDARIADGVELEKQRKADFDKALDEGNSLIQFFSGDIIKYSMARGFDGLRLKPIGSSDDDDAFYTLMHTRDKMRVVADAPSTDTNTDIPETAPETPNAPGSLVPAERNTFLDELSGAKFKETRNPDAYDDAEMFLHPSKNAGYALKNGEVFSVFDWDNDPQTLAEILDDAHKRGGTNLEYLADTPLAEAVKTSPFGLVTSFPADQPTVPHHWASTFLDNWNDNETNVMFASTNAPFQPSKVNNYNAAKIAQELSLVDQSFTPLPDNERGASGDGYHKSGPWGKFGAAGVLLSHTDEDGVTRYLLTKNPTNKKNNPGKWQLPGGALEENENPFNGAGRELSEEVDVPETVLKDIGSYGFDVSETNGWTYTTVHAATPEMFDAKANKSYETEDAKWLTEGELHDLLQSGELHPGLEETIADKLAHYTPPVDAPVDVPEPDVTPDDTPEPSTQFIDVVKKAKPGDKLVFGKNTGDEQTLEKVGDNDWTHQAGNSAFKTPSIPDDLVAEDWGSDPDNALFVPKLTLGDDDIHTQDLNLPSDAEDDAPTLTPIQRSVKNAKPGDKIEIQEFPVGDKETFTKVDDNDWTYEHSDGGLTTGLTDDLVAEDWTNAEEDVVFIPAGTPDPTPETDTTGEPEFATLPSGHTFDFGEGKTLFKNDDDTWTYEPISEIPLSDAAAKDIWEHNSKTPEPVEKSFADKIKDAESETSISRNLASLKPGDSIMMEYKALNGDDMAYSWSPLGDGTGNGAASLLNKTKGKLSESMADADFAASTFAAHKDKDGSSITFFPGFQQDTTPEPEPTPDPTPNVPDPETLEPWEKALLDIGTEPNTFDGAESNADIKAKLDNANTGASFTYDSTGRTLVKNDDGTWTATDDNSTHPSDNVAFAIWDALQDGETVTFDPKYNHPFTASNMADILTNAGDGAMIELKAGNNPGFYSRIGGQWHEANSDSYISDYSMYNRTRKSFKQDPNSITWTDASDVSEPDTPIQSEVITSGEAITNLMYAKDSTDIADVFDSMPIGDSVHMKYTIGDEAKDIIYTRTPEGITVSDTEGFNYKTNTGQASSSLFGNKNVFNHNPGYDLTYVTKDGDTSSLKTFEDVTPEIQASVELVSNSEAFKNLPVGDKFTVDGYTFEKVGDDSWTIGKTGEATGPDKFSDNHVSKLMLEDHYTSYDLTHIPANNTTESNISYLDPNNPPTVDDLDGYPSGVELHVTESNVTYTRVPEGWKFMQSDGKMSDNVFDSEVIQEDLFYHLVTKGEEVSVSLPDNVLVDVHEPAHTDTSSSSPLAKFPTSEADVDALPEGTKVLNKVTGVYYTMTPSGMLFTYSDGSKDYIADDSDIAFDVIKEWGPDFTEIQLPDVNSDVPDEKSYLTEYLTVTDVSNYPLDTVITNETYNAKLSRNSGTWVMTDAQGNMAPGQTPSAVANTVNGWLDLNDKVSVSLPEGTNTDAPKFPTTVQEIAALPINAKLHRGDGGYLVRENNGWSFVQPNGVKSATDMPDWDAFNASNSWSNTNKHVELPTSNTDSSHVPGTLPTTLTDVENLPDSAELHNKSNGIKLSKLNGMWKKTYSHGDETDYVFTDSDVFHAVSGSDDYDLYVPNGLSPTSVPTKFTEGTTVTPSQIDAIPVGYALRFVNPDGTPDGANGYTRKDDGWYRVFHHGGVNDESLTSDEVAEYVNMHLTDPFDGGDIDIISPTTTSLGDDASDNVDGKTYITSPISANDAKTYPDNTIIEHETYGFKLTKQDGSWSLSIENTEGTHKYQDQTIANLVNEWLGDKGLVSVVTPESTATLMTYTKSNKPTAYDLDNLNVGDKLQWMLHGETPEGDRGYVKMDDGWHRVSLGGAVSKNVTTPDEVIESIKDQIDVMYGTVQVNVGGKPSTPSSIPQTVADMNALPEGFKFVHPVGSFYKKVPGGWRFTDANGKPDIDVDTPEYTLDILMAWGSAVTVQMPSNEQTLPKTVEDLNALPYGMKLLRGDGSFYEKSSNGWWYTNKYGVQHSEPNSSDAVLQDVSKWGPGASMTTGYVPKPTIQPHKLPTTLEELDSLPNDLRIKHLDGAFFTKTATGWEYTYEYGNVESKVPSQVLGTVSVWGSSATLETPSDTVPVQPQTPKLTTDNIGEMMDSLKPEGSFTSGTKTINKDADGNWQLVHGNGNITPKTQAQTKKYLTDKLKKGEDVTMNGASTIKVGDFVVGKKPHTSNENATGYVTQVLGNGDIKLKSVYGGVTEMNIEKHKVEKITPHPSTAVPGADQHTNVKEYKLLTTDGNPDSKWYGVDKPEVPVIIMAPSKYIPDDIFEQMKDGYAKNHNGGNLESSTYFHHVKKLLDDGDTAHPAGVSGKPINNMKTDSIYDFFVSRQYLTQEQADKLKEYVDANKDQIAVGIAEAEALNKTNAEQYVKDVDDWNRANGIQESPLNIQSANYVPAMFQNGDVFTGERFSKYDGGKYAKANGLAIDKSKLTNAEYDAIKKYTGTAYHNLQQELIMYQGDVSKLSSSNKEFVKNLDNALTKGGSVTKEPVRLTRYFRLSQMYNMDTGKVVMGPADMQKGARIKQFGYGSAGFDKEGVNLGGNARYEIIVPAGVTLAYVDAISSHPGENETIIPRNWEMIVHHQKPGAGLPEFLVEMVPTGWKPDYLTDVDKAGTIDVIDHTLTPGPIEDN